MEKFVEEIKKNIRSKVKSLKREQIVGMSVENLFMVTPTPKTFANLSPAGYSELFSKVAKETVPGFLI